jgi:hypothetical protein
MSNEKFFHTLCIFGDLAAPANGAFLLAFSSLGRCGRVTDVRDDLFTVSVTIAFTNKFCNLRKGKSLTSTNQTIWPRDGRVLGWNDPTFLLAGAPKKVSGVVPAHTRGSKASRMHTFNNQCSRGSKSLSRLTCANLSSGLYRRERR